MDTLYTVMTSSGMTVRDFGTDDINEAEEIASRKFGSDNVESIEPATDEDIRWVRAMGGWLPIRALERLGSEKE